jgi:hypothetical protein
MKLMKLLIELGTSLDAAQAEKAKIEEQVVDVDQAIAKIFGEFEKTKAVLAHTRSAHILKCPLEILSLDILQE